MADLLDRALRHACPANPLYQDSAIGLASHRYDELDELPFELHGRADERAMAARLLDQDIALYGEAAP